MEHDLMKIPLSKWIDWMNTYGVELDKDAKIPKTKDEELAYQWDLYSKWYSFWFGGGDIRQLSEFDTVVKKVSAMLIAHKKQTLPLKIKANWFKVFSWKGQKWQVQAMIKKVIPGSKEEFEAGQHFALIYLDIMEGKPEVIYEMCAMQLRHPGEEYSYDLTQSRIELMKELPLYIALCVREFVQETVKLLDAHANRIGNTNRG